MTEQDLKHYVFCHTLGRVLSEVWWHHFSTHRKALQKPSACCDLKLLHKISKANAAIHYKEGQKE